jgi:hypothetical protein
MKKIVIASMILVFVSASAQDSVDNHVKLLSNKYGQVLKLKKLAVACDDDSAFILKKPHDILPIEDGSFFVIDNGQVLKFANDGKFIKIIVDKGQGPAQASHLFQLYRRNNDLIINTGFMNKLMVFDFDGVLKSEFMQHKNPGLQKNKLNLSGSTFTIMAHYKDNSFIILCNIPPAELADDKTLLEKKPVLLLSGKNESIKQLFEIPLDSVVVKTKFGKFLLPVLSVIYTSDDQFIYFSNTERYEIKRYNLALNKIDLTWKRNYQPALIPSELKSKISYGLVYETGDLKNGKSESYKEPERKYFVDIKKIFVVNSFIWVMTSTLDKEKGVLFDVFNNCGEYVVSIFLKPPEGLKVYDFYLADVFCIFNDYIFITQNDEEDNPIIVKYKIIGDEIK